MNAILRASLLLLAGAVPAVAHADGSRDFTFYIQQTWPQQTLTNRQIEEINDLFGTDFDDWSDVPNLGIGAQLFWTVAPGVQFGVQFDYGAGAIKGSEQVLTEAGPAKLSFEQRYDLYADLYAVGKWNPWTELQRVRPFLYGAIGVAYEDDTTTLKLRNDYIDSSLRVKNDGWFPTYSVGVGVDVPFSPQSDWYFEFGVAYVWASMTNKVPATGDLAPSATVTAETELTGPNYWLGFGRSF